jgi:RimJ/RimL family protein N-acetyltransferase
VDHEISVEGFGYSLEPIRLTDAEFVWSLRSDPERTSYLNAVAGGVSGQERFLREYLKTPNDYYFVLRSRSSGQPEGLAGIYDLDFERSSGSWGRWILVPGSLAASESVWLTYRVVFDHLKLTEIRCQTLIENGKVIAFHDACGLKRAQTLPDFLLKDGQSFAAVEHVLTVNMWRDGVEARLARQAQAVARRLETQS